jgi:DhnA family fructose-bisphosphate aldolase class Ia
LGADWVKVPYVEGFEQVVERCYVPVVVLGGPARDDPRETLAMVKAGMAAGGSGGTIGRNIWQAEKPANMAAAIAGIIHDGLEVDDALALLAA